MIFFVFLLILLIAANLRSDGGGAVGAARGALQQVRRPAGSRLEHSGIRLILRGYGSFTWGGYGSF